MTHAVIIAKGKKEMIECAMLRGHKATQITALELY